MCGDDEIVSFSVIMHHWVICTIFCVLLLKLCNMRLDNKMGVELNEMQFVNYAIHPSVATNSLKCGKKRIQAKAEKFTDNVVFIELKWLRMWRLFYHSITSFSATVFKEEQVPILKSPILSSVWIKLFYPLYIYLKYNFCFSKKK